jgi:RimJ/RimL family protein N-acetyltransferase
MVDLPLVPVVAKSGGQVSSRPCQAALARAFGTEQLHKVCGQVLAVNTASLAFHRRLGFAEEGVLRQQHRSGGPGGAHYHDVHCFGLLRADWPGPVQEPTP